MHSQSFPSQTAQTQPPRHTVHGYLLNEAHALHALDMQLQALMTTLLVSRDPAPQDFALHTSTATWNSRSNFLDGCQAWVSSMYVTMPICPFRHLTFLSAFTREQVTVGATCCQQCAKLGGECDDLSYGN